MTEVDLVALLTKFGAACAALLAAHYAGVWRWGREYRELEARFDREKHEWRVDRDEWKALALQHAGVLALATDTTRLALPPKVIG